jgi:hypothetical protein
MASEREKRWLTEQKLTSQVEVLTPNFLETLGKFSILLLQGEEAPANLRQVPNNGLIKAELKINL